MDANPMIKIILLSLVLMTPTETPKTELKAMDQFFDRLLQNATPIEQEYRRINR
jgi:hypothetical protein